MVGLEEFALQQTEPNFNLIEKGGHWQAANRAAWSVSPPMLSQVPQPNAGVAWTRGSDHYRGPPLLSVHHGVGLPQRRPFLKRSGSRQSVCADGTDHRLTHQQHLTRPS